MYHQAAGSCVHDDLRTSLRINDSNHKSGGTNLNDWMKAMHSFGEEFASLEPTLAFVREMVSEELVQIKEKEEGALRELFQQQMNKYKEVS